MPPNHETVQRDGTNWLGPVQLIVRMLPAGRVYATSPQAPGLTCGRASLAELRAELPGLLAFYFGSPGPFEVTEHHERHYDVAGGELVTRMALDGHRAERQAVYERIGRALAVPGQAAALVSAVTSTVGEAVYVCAVPSDTLGWLTGQLSGPGDAFTAALTTAEEFLLTLPVTAGDGLHPAWAAGPSGPQTRLSELIGRIAVVTPPQAARLEAV